jgi:hypothetical protein
MKGSCSLKGINEINKLLTFYLSRNVRDKVLKLKNYLENLYVYASGSGISRELLYNSKMTVKWDKYLYHRSSYL